MKKTFMIIPLLIVFMLIFSVCHAQPIGYQQFMLEVSSCKVDYGRPEIVVNTERHVIVIFKAEKTMKKIVYNKKLDDFRVWDIFKFESSSDVDPYVRLKEAVKTYE